MNPRGRIRTRSCATAALAGVLLLGLVSVGSAAGPVANARHPAPSPDGSEIAFSHMGDLWTVSAAGGRARRVTVHSAYDDDPIWSPDGMSIAFTSDREGNDDVFVMPSQGGVPTKLTCYSSWDYAQCWTRDGAALLFCSYRDTLGLELHEVSVAGGLPRKVIADRAFNVSVSPDGRWIAYARGRTPWWRQHYRGSASRDIWIRGYDGGRSTRIVASVSDDDRPMWGSDGRTLYFMSERSDSVMNIWSVVVDLPKPGGEGEPRVVQGPTQVTTHAHDGVQAARISDDGTLIVYEWDAGLWKLPVPGGRPQEIAVTAASDLKWNETLRLDLSSGATEFAFSPDEDELAFVARGEIFVCPFEDGGAGKAMRVTETSAREKDIEWMPDGESLVFASDREGSYDLYVVKSVEEGEESLSKALRREIVRLTDSPEDDFKPSVSPDGETIAYLVGDHYLWAMGADGSDKRQMLPEAEVLHVDWSPDSKWIAVSRTTMGHKEDIFVLPADGGEATNVTDHPNDDFQPQWSDDGRRLSFASRTDDGQYMLKYIWLRRDDFWKSAEEREEEEEAAAEAAPEGDEESEEPTVDVVIDFEDINERTETVMNMRGGYDFYAATRDGHYYAFRSRTLGSTDLWMVDWEGNRINQVSEGGSNPTNLYWNADGTTCYYITHGGRISSFDIDPGSGSIAGRGGVGFSARMTVDVAAERRQMFNEAWRLLWSRFYDPEFHGVDWLAVREKYEPLAMAAYTEQEFRAVVSEMIGELSASHLGIYKGGGGGVSTGCLGIYHDGHYDGPGVRVRKVLKDGPADRAGIVAGEHILSIGGTDISPGDNYHCLLENTVGEEVLVEVAANPRGKDAREIRMRPVGGWSMRSLVYEEWVSGNRRKVETLSGGRLGYLHIPGMGLSNLFDFEEDLFAQGSDKDGMVIDIRGNGGGSVHDLILRYLDRKTYGYETTRTRPPSYSPLELWVKPLVLVIDESCYSDAEIFPMGWKALGLGPVVGTPTYGAVIGTNDLELIDGTMFRVPSSGWFDLEGRNLENWGIEPDVRVDSEPEEAGRGRDGQLETAVDVLLREMAGG